MGDVDLSLIASNPTAYTSSSPAGMLPGDIVFPTFDWFGMSGTNVVFTASASNNYVFPGGRPSVTAVNTTPPYQPGASQLASVPESPSSQAQSPSSSIAGW